MSYPCLRQSKNYIWSTSWVLGRGATATVYQGEHKETGEAVAVKMFNRMSLDRPREVQKREFDVLEKVNHENIVRLLAVEEDETHHRVLVMELCTGGSLFSILDDPENHYGLPEEEFLVVLRDFTSGTKHLRDNNIIHRDLKPGNIMKYTTVDGRTVYKLTDFGAARELEDDQQFMSLYGTEEYLHPQMYERAVLRQPSSRRFDATVDLWSIGVTLYHVATGQLPFRPYGGRRNKKGMHYLTTQKESGVIAGVQIDDSFNSIKWYRDLPSTCLLSVGLKQLFVPILARLLESDASKIWTFDAFFESVTEIFASRMFHVHYINAAMECNIYVSPRSTLSIVRDRISQQTGVSPKNQLLLYEKNLFEKVVNPAARASSFPATEKLRPIFMFNAESKESIEIPALPQARIAKFPDFAPDRPDEDASVAKTWCAIVYVTKRLVERLARTHDALCTAPLFLANVLEEQVSHLREDLTHMQDGASSLERELNSTIKCQAYISQMASLLPAGARSESHLEKLKKLVLQKRLSLSAVSETLSKAELDVNAVATKVSNAHPILRAWEQVCQEVPNLKGCQETAATYVRMIRENWAAMSRFKSLKEPTQQDIQFHKRERRKIQQSSLKLMTLLQENCIKPCELLADRLTKWLKEAMPVHRQCSQMEVALQSYSDMISSYRDTLRKTEADFDAIFNQFLATASAYKPATPAATPVQTPSPTKPVASTQTKASLLVEQQPLVGGANTSTNHVEERDDHVINVVGAQRTMTDELQDIIRQQIEILQIAAENDVLLKKVITTIPN